MKIMDTTLLIVIKNDKLLLAEKKRGFGKGKINGVGGKRQPNETIEEAMIRETEEEIGITPKDYKLRGIIDFDELYKGEREINRMYVYVANDFYGTLTESDEMKPIWFDKKNIPFERMFGDDKFWYPAMLDGKNFKGKFVFDDDFNLISHEIAFFDEDL